MKFKEILPMVKQGIQVQRSTYPFFMYLFEAQVDGKNTTIFTVRDDNFQLDGESMFEEIYNDLHFADDWEEVKRCRVFIAIPPDKEEVVSQVLDSLDNSFLWQRQNITVWPLDKLFSKKDSEQVLASRNNIIKNSDLLLVPISKRLKLTELHPVISDEITLAERNNLEIFLYNLDNHQLTDLTDSDLEVDCDFL